MILAEFKKLKGSSMLWIGIGSCFILPVMALGINLSNPDSFTWAAYVQQNLWPQIILLWPCIFGTFGSYIFCRERIENTYKNLLVIPVGRIRLSGMAQVIDAAVAAHEAAVVGRRAQELPGAGRGEHENAGAHPGARSGSPHLPRAHSLSGGWWR